MKTLGTRVKELRKLAVTRGVADRVGDLPDARLAVQAYATVLGFNTALAYDLELSLKRIEELSAVLGK